MLLVPIHGLLLLLIRWIVAAVVIVVVSLIMLSLILVVALILALALLLILWLILMLGVALLPVFVCFTHPASQIQQQLLLWLSREKDWRPLYG